MDLFLDINPELGKPQGSYFGLTVTDGYDWHICYSYAWEIKTYFDGDRSVHKCFPDIPEEDFDGMMHQCIAIKQGLTDMPEKRFVLKTTLEDLR